MNREYTVDLRMCDDNGVVDRVTLNRLRQLGGYEPYPDGGPDFPCTGSAHLAGEHIRCTSPAHEEKDLDCVREARDKSREFEDVDRLRALRS